MNAIHEHIGRLRIVDGHEHLPPRESRERDRVDLFGLLHYLDSDFVTAGMKREHMSRQSGLSDEQKAELFLTYWAKSGNTAYARAFRAAMVELYGMVEWTKAGLLDLNDKVKAASANPEWYDYVLRERSGIDLAITLVQTTKVDFELFRPVMFLDFTYMLRARQDVEAVEREAGASAHSLTQYLAAVDAVFDRFVREGMVATKLGHAYWRTLACGKPTAHEAEAAFNRLAGHALNERLSQEEARPLQDYLIHHIVRRSAEAGLPIQIHTGHHETSVTNNGNRIPNSRAADLLPLLLEYREAKFVLLHAGFPYSDEYLSIGKNFPNVYIDFTWNYIISPTATKRLLHQAIEMVPQSKMQGFGGDYNFVEGTYAHQKLARRIVGDVLTEKVADGALTEREAIAFANDVFRNNLIDLYGFDFLERA